jgi:hypothetical protein
MTIAATAITIDGDTAWLAVEYPAPLGKATIVSYRELDRPCDRCHGTGRMLEDDASRPRCPDCHGTGQHTFTLDVECVLPMCVNGKRGYWQDGHPCGYCNATGTYQLSVHVVAMLEIKDRPGGPMRSDGPMLYRFGPSWWGWSDSGDYIAVTLPLDAAPGMYAVRLAVHT